MELTRSNVRKYLDDGFKSTNYCKKVRGTNEFQTLKTMSIYDLDFIGVLEKLVSDIKFKFYELKSADWIPSARQKYLFNALVDINNQIINTQDKRQTLYLHLYDDFYWTVSDYFDDYNNKTEEIVQEEVNLILPQLENFLNKYDSMKK